MYIARVPYKDYAKSREYSNRKNKEWYTRNRDYQIAKVARRQEELRVWLGAEKSNLQCACGENHIAALQFHHRDPAQKTYAISAAVRRKWSVKRLKEEIAKCDIMCANLESKDGGYSLKAEQQPVKLLARGRYPLLTPSRCRITVLHGSDKAAKEVRLFPSGPSSSDAIGRRTCLRSTVLGVRLSS